MDKPSLRFFAGKCIEAHAEKYPSEIINGFFANVIQHYIGKTPEEISIHARKFAEAIKDWPAPSDMKFGWALTKASVSAHMETYAAEAEAARKENLRTAKLEMTA